MPPFNTDRLHLRQATVQDAPFFLSLLNSPGWLKYIGDRNVHTTDEAEAYIENRILPVYETPGHGSYVVQLHHKVEPLGFVGVFRRDTLPAPDFGFAFLPEGQGKGYALEASRAILSTPEVAALPELLAITLPHNTRSRRLLEKLGFADTGDTAPVEKDETTELLIYRRV